MVTLLAVLGVLAVLFAAAAVATRDGGQLAEAPPDAPDLVLPEGPLGPDDVAALRFPLALRGYRMAEVDLALDRLAAELAERDRRIALLSDLAQQSPAVRGGGPVDSAGARPRTGGDWSA